MEEKRCKNCGKSRHNNPSGIPQCKEGSPTCSEPKFHKWVPIRDIRKGNMTEKIVDFTNCTNKHAWAEGIVLHPGSTDLSINSIMQIQSIPN